MNEHEPHGRCSACGYPVHRYPFGWQHVGTGMFTCEAIAPIATCCPMHEADRRVAALFSSL